MKYLRKYYYIIFIIFFLIIFSLNYRSYNRSVRTINSNFETEIDLIKYNIFNSLENAFVSYSISDLILTKEMKTKSQILLEKYNQDPKPKNWDLTTLKSQMPDYEIYIIDRNLKIINTTLTADYGLDLKQYEELSQLLDSYLETENFVADKFSLGRKTGLINKYSYQVTPDQNYLLELSINIKNRFPILKNFNIFTLAEKLDSEYPQVRSINFYKFAVESNQLSLLNSSRPREPNKINTLTKSIVKNTVKRKEVLTNIRDEGSYQITSIYFPVLNSANLKDSEWWSSFVVNLRYDNQKLLAVLRQEKIYFIFNVFLLFILFVLFSLIMIFLIRKIESLAYYDHLTGLLNRKAFERHFKEINKSNKHKKLALLYLDLDGFKEVNDFYGHDTGDDLLKLVSQRLKNAVRADDKVSRIGGDEFTILLTSINDKVDVKKIIKKIESKLEEPFQIKGETISISSSIGYSIDYRTKNTFQNMIIKADSAMYKIKNNKKIIKNNLE